MKKQSLSPVAILIFAFIWYMLKLAVMTVGESVSMAAVEGVAIRRDVVQDAMTISPVFVYLAFTLMYLSSSLFGFCNARISLAAKIAFHFHMAFFALAFVVFSFFGEVTVYTFFDTFTGSFFLHVGNWLPIILIGIFTAVYARTGSSAKHSTLPGHQAKAGA